MALGDDYCTTAELKTRLNISDSVDDTVLGMAISTASRSVEKYCRRQFNNAASASSRVFYPLSEDIVLVHDFCTTTGFVLATDTDDDGVYETIWDESSYLLEPLNGIRDGVDGWPYWRIRAVSSDCFYNNRRPSVQVTAIWGWGAVPSPVKEATLALAEEVYKMKDSPFGIAGFGEYGMVRVRENPKIVALLKDYRRTAVRVR